jgi:hypothetical protein
LQARNSRTIEKLLAVLTEGIEKVVDQQSIQNNQLGIHICILDERLSIERWQTVEPDNLRPLRFSPEADWSPKPGDVVGGWQVHCPSAK